MEKLPLSDEQSCVRSGWTNTADPHQAVEELWEQLRQPNLAIVIFFCASSYQQDALAQAFRQRFGGTMVVGCTTSGELGPNGYTDDSISAISLAGPEFHATVQTIEDLEKFEFGVGNDLVRRAQNEMALKAPDIKSSQMFSMLLIDGLCMREEAVVSALHASLGEIPLFGGSAGDNLEFQETCVYVDGAFRSGVGVFILIATDSPFKVFKTEHFVSGENKMVITEADPLRRTVTQINAEPAGREYARMVGLSPDELTPMIFAAHPVVVRVGGAHYVRSIQKVNEDESLTFFCAIDEGIVLTVAEGIDLADNLAQQFQRVRDDIGDFQLVLGCDCVFRKLELQQNQATTPVSTMLRDNNVIGFSTYGEQFNAMHVNQTFTGVAIGRKAQSDG